MKPAAPTIALAVRTARGERRRIRSFLKQVEGLGVEVADLPPRSVKALDEAEKFLGRYLDLLDHETPTADQLAGVLEALSGIDRVVKNAMAEILKSLGWRPEEKKRASRPRSRDTRGASRSPSDRSSRTIGAASSAASDSPRPPRRGGAKVIPFPGPGTRGRRA